jgi:DNA-binding response OmpR family regulator
MSRLPVAAHDDPEAALRAVRHRFTSGFLQRCDSFALLIERIGPLVASAESESLIHLVHRTAGLAGMIGMRTVSDRAGDLENLLRGTHGDSLDLARARELVGSLRAAFETDLAGPAPAWTASAGEARGQHVLVVEDDPDQRSLVVAGLRQAGYTVSDVDRGEDALPAARETRPDVILLDIDLPGATGFDVCRSFRLDPDLHDTPVIFLTAREAPGDRVAGLTAGADDYLVKPIDANELLLRMDLVIRRRHNPASASDAVLTYDTFLATARELIARNPCALALIRLPRDRLREAISAIAREVRRKDLVGRYDDAHAMLLLPDVAPTEAVEHMATLEAALSLLDIGIHAGLTPASRGASFAALLEQADQALAEARYRRQPVVLHGHEPAGIDASPTTIVVAEDDPDVMRILDGRLAAAGFRTVLAFDGQAALDATMANAPDIVLLDLMMPKLTGFDVMTELKRSAARVPPIVVMSARGREADVTRAFELGAADYLTKPFGPEELLARLARLVR